MGLPTPRAIIFDWDNTLVDTWPLIGQALNATLSKWGLPEWTEEEVKTRVRRSMRDSFPEIFGKNWEEQGRFYQDQYCAIHLQYLKPLPEAEELLQTIQDKKLFCTVVSNKKAP